MSRISAMPSRRVVLSLVVCAAAVVTTLVKLDGASAKFDNPGSLRAPDLSRAAAAWSAGFETGDFSEWSLHPQQKAWGRAAVVTSVEGLKPRQGTHALRVEVRPGDSNVAGSGSGERTELLIGGDLTGAGEGREAYWTWSTYFSKDFRSPGGSWNSFVQFHHTGAGSQSNIHFQVTDRKVLTMRVMGGSHASPMRKDFVLGDLKRGRWYDLVFHVKWSADAKVGFVQVFVDGWEIVPKTFTPTLYAGQGAYFKLGYYRAAYEETSVVYADAIRRIDVDG